jgi:hypothetical protein
MAWLSIGIGVVSFALVWRACRPWRPAGAGAGEVTLRAGGGTGLAALAALALGSSAIAAALAALAAVALAADLRVVRRALVNRARRNAPAVGPFHNAS